MTALTAAEVALTPVETTETPVEMTSAVIDTAASPTAKTEQAAMTVLKIMIMRYRQRKWVIFISSRDLKKL